MFIYLCAKPSVSIIFFAFSHLADIYPKKLFMLFTQQATKGWVS